MPGIPSWLCRHAQFAQPVCGLHKGSQTAPGGCIQRRVPQRLGDLPRDGGLPLPVDHMQIAIQREACGADGCGKPLQTCMRMDGDMAVAWCDVPPVAVRSALLKRSGE